MAASSAGYGWSVMTAGRWGRSAGSWIILGIGRTDHHPDSQSYAPAGPGDHFPGACLERPVRASALARTMSGSRGSGESSSSHGRSLRTLRRPMRIRFITDLPKAI